MARPPRFKIAIAAPSAPPARGGGVASAHYNLFRALQSLGCDVTLLTFNETAGIPDGQGIMRAGGGRHLRRVLAVAAAAYLKLRGSSQPAYQLEDILGALPGVLRMNRRLARIDPDVLIIPDRGAPGLLLRRQRGAVIQIVHHVPMRFVDQPLVGVFSREDAVAATVLEQKALRQVKAVVCPSRYMERVFRDTYQFGGEVCVIPNAIVPGVLDAVAAMDMRSEMGLPPAAPVIYLPSAGSLFKGARYIPEIVNGLAGALPGPIGFYLSGSMEEGLAAQLARIPANARIFWPGAVGYEQNLALVKSCSFGVSPTLLENFSMAILEAGCCGVPMVAFDTGGTSELIVEGTTGFVVPCPDLPGLLAKSAALLDGSVRERMSRAAVEHIRKSFGPESVATRYLRLFERLVA